MVLFILQKALPKIPPKDKPLPPGAHRTPPKGYPEDRRQYAIPAYYSYRLDKPKYVRAAIAYFGMPKNHQKYSPEERKSIARRILRAAKKFGIEVSDEWKAKFGLKKKEK